MELLLQDSKFKSLQKPAAVSLILAAAVVFSALVCVRPLDGASAAWWSTVQECMPAAAWVAILLLILVGFLLFDLDRWLTRDLDQRGVEPPHSKSARQPRPRA